MRERPRKVNNVGSTEEKERNEWTVRRRRRKRRNDKGDKGVRVPGAESSFGTKIGDRVLRENTHMTSAEGGVTGVPKNQTK